MECRYVVLGDPVKIRDVMTQKVLVWIEQIDRRTSVSQELEAALIYVGCFLQNWASTRRRPRAYKIDRHFRDYRENNPPSLEVQQVLPN